MFRLALLFYSVSMVNLSCSVATIFSMANQSCSVATIFSSLAFISSSISMANLSHLVAVSFSSLALLSSSVSMANLSCLLASTFSSLSFLSNSFSTHCFNFLRVARCCFSWSIVSFLLYLFALLSAFFPFVLQSLKLCLL